MPSMQWRMEVLCKSASPQVTTGRTAGTEFASLWPITAAEFLATICGKSLNPFTQRKKTPAPDWAYGYRAASYRNTAAQFVCGAVQMATRPEPHFPSSYPCNTKSAAPPNPHLLSY